jgi:hypothetical protein
MISISICIPLRGGFFLLKKGTNFLHSFGELDSRLRRTLQKGFLALLDEIV